MKRILVLAVLFLLAGASSAFAQEAPDSTNAPAAAVVSQSPPSQTGYVFTKAAIEKAVAPRDAEAPSPFVPQTRKPFLKTPWPYVIIAVVVVVVVLAAGGSNGFY